MAKNGDVQVFVSGNPLVGKVMLPNLEVGVFGSRFVVASAETLGRRPTQEDAFLLQGGFMGKSNMVGFLFPLHPPQLFPSSLSTPVLLPLPLLFGRV